MTATQTTTTLREYLASCGCDVSGSNGTGEALLRAAKERIETGEDSAEDLAYLGRAVKRAEAESAE